MKLSTFFLLGSVAVNAALAIIIGAGLSGDRLSRAKPGARDADSRTEVPRAPAAPAPATWAELSTADLAAQLDRLRAEGFPPSIIRAILAAQIREGFAARRKALEGAQRDTPFWKNARPDAKIAAQLTALGKEEQKALKDLLGPDPDNGSAANFRHQFPGWSADKADQLAAISDRYNEQRQDLYSAARGPGGSIRLTPDEQQKMVALDKAMHAEFAGVLSPHELEDYDLRTSNTASQLRYNLSAFDATEQEFRTLYQLQSAYNDQFGQMNGPLSPDQQRARSEAQKQLGDQLAAALGPDRYAEYQRATDYGFRQTSQLVARLDLPPDTANQLYAIQKDSRDRFNEIGRNPDQASSEQVSQQRAALQQDVLTRISTALGGNTTAVEAYKQYGGSWLQMFQPPRPPTK